MMSDESGETKVAFLAVSAIKQKDLANAVGGALQHAIIMRYMLEADQTEQGKTAATWDTQEEWLLRGNPLWVSDSNGGHEGHQKLHAAEAVQEPIVTEAPADDSESPAPAPTLPKLKKTAQVVPTLGTAAGKGTPSSSKKQEKAKGKESDKPGDQTTTMPARRQKKRIRRKCCRPSRTASGRPRLTSMRVAMIRVRTSQRRKQRLLRVLVQSSRRPGVLVLSHSVVPLPPEVGEVRWQEAWVLGWLRLQDRRRSKPQLTHVFLSLFAVMCVRGLEHSPLT